MTKKNGRRTRNAGRTRGNGRKTRIIGQPGYPRDAAPEDSLGRLFAGRVTVPLLKMFFLSPSREFYQRELVAATSHRLFVVQTALKRLADAGLIERVTRGNRAYYRANQSSPVFPDFKSLVLKTVGLGENLRAQLQRLAGRVNIAFIYGSIARGEERETSDIDVMLIGEISGREIASVLEPVRNMLNREINPTVYTPTELRRKVRDRSPFIREVLKGPKIYLLGNDRALTAIVRRRAS